VSGPAFDSEISSWEDPDFFLTVTPQEDFAGEMIGASSRVTPVGWGSEV
jgi:hypothetical protein